LNAKILIEETLLFDFPLNIRSLNSQLNNRNLRGKKETHHYILFFFSPALTRSHFVADPISREEWILDEEEERRS